MTYIIKKIAVYGRDFGNMRTAHIQVTLECGHMTYINKPTQKRVRCTKCEQKLGINK